MTRLKKLLPLAFLGGLCLAMGSAAAQDKVEIKDLPKPVVDAINAKFPKAELKRATKEVEDGKTVFEVVFNFEKKHLHGVVSAEGKLMEIHSHIDIKNVPEKVVKVVKDKYPTAMWEVVHQRADIEGKILGYEVALDLGKGSSVEVNVDPSGKITRETRVDPKKDGK